MDCYDDAIRYAMGFQQIKLEQLREQQYRLIHRNKFSRCCGASVLYLGTTFTKASFDSEGFIWNSLEKFRCSNCENDNCEIVEVIK